VGIGIRFCYKVFPAHKVGHLHMNSNKAIGNAHVGINPLRAVGLGLNFNSGTMNSGGLILNAGKKRSMQKMW
jgi:hypothetical protein